MDKFNKDIMPLIALLRRDIDLGDADIYLRLYMVGKTPRGARPIIMVCCVDTQVRAQMDQAIRASHIPQAFPEFGLGASALPLEQRGLSVALAGGSLRGSLKRARNEDDDWEDEDKNHGRPLLRSGSSKQRSNPQHSSSDAPSASYTVSAFHTATMPSGRQPAAPSFALAPVLHTNSRSRMSRTTEPVQSPVTPTWTSVISMA